MARIRASLLCAAFLGLLACQAAADTPDAGQVKPALGKDDIVREGISQKVIDPKTYTSNGTEIKGWHKTQECWNHFCLYVNREVGNGRGMAMVTTSNSFQKIKRMEKHLNVKTNNRYESTEPPFYVTEVPGKGQRLIANKTIRRGTKLTHFSPVLWVHSDFLFPEEGKGPAEKERDRIIDAAVELLPEETRKKFLNQLGEAGKTKTARDIVRAYPFDVTLGAIAGMASGQTTNEGNHIVNIPEVGPFVHDCRPNVAFHFSADFSHHTTAARKIEVGQELSINFLHDVWYLREQRQAVSQKWRGHGCTCDHCKGYGNLEELSKSDERIEELKELEKALNDFESYGVTVAMIARLVELYELERMDIRLADMYSSAALNYASLGYKKRALKYARLAIQAAIVEGGEDSNDAVAMRVFQREPEEHYSWQKRTKLKTKAAKAAKSTKE